MGSWIPGRDRKNCQYISEKLHFQLRRAIKVAKRSLELDRILNLIAFKRRSLCSHLWWCSAEAKKWV